MNTAPVKSFDDSTNVRIAEANNPSSSVVHFPDSEPLRLACDQLLAPISIAYQTYGELNADKSNAILICHALTGDQYVASVHPMTKKPGWWETLVGPGKPIDTDRFFVICPNILGSCMGSTGPASIDPKTGRPYALNFPVITIGDMVNAQVRLIDHLGIDQLFCILGGSMGGMQVLEWASSHTERVYSAVPIATAAWHSPQNIAFHEVGRQAVMADPDWCAGDYHAHQKVPRNGLAVAFSFNADFQVESYLRHQGSTFVDRFDANSYLYITRAMDYFDLEAEHGDVLANAFRGTKTRFLVVSFTSDWLYPTRESREIVRALNAVAANVSFVEIETESGHDSFLLDEPEFFATV
ncbi:MAG: homoserine O-acetyltransferase, partial [Alphaproteobacteria bacterium]